MGSKYYLFQRRILRTEKKTKQNVLHRLSYFRFNEDTKGYRRINYI